MMKKKFEKAGLTDFLSAEEINLISETLLAAPRITTLRINNLLIEESGALEYVKSNLNSKFNPRLCDQVSGVIEVDALGPNEVVPAELKVIISCECAKSVLRGANVYAPGIIAIIDEGIEPSIDNPVSVWADLCGKVIRGYRNPVEDGLIKFIGNGILRMKRQDIILSQMPKGLAIEITEQEWLHPPLNHLNFSVFPQNIPSILTVHALSPFQGSTILDMCASPGGKTSHIASFVSNQATIIALDKNRNKVKKLEDNLKRLGVTCAHCFVANSAKISDPFNGLTPNQFIESEGNGALLNDCFDFILLDPPCTGFGQRPDIGAETDIDFVEHASFQFHLFETAIKLLKAGGSLVYSTCSMSLWENEDVVNRILRKYPNLVLEPIGSPLGSPCLPLEGLNDYQRTCMRRFWPNEDNSIGFFICKFKKL